MNDRSTHTVHTNTHTNSSTYSLPNGLSLGITQILVGFGIINWNGQTLQEKLNENLKNNIWFDVGILALQQSFFSWIHSSDHKPVAPSQSWTLYMYCTVCYQAQPKLEATVVTQANSLFAYMFNVTLTMLLVFIKIFLISFHWLHRDLAPTKMIFQNKDYKSRRFWSTMLCMISCLHIWLITNNLF